MPLPLRPLAQTESSHPLRYWIPSLVGVLLLYVYFIMGTRPKLEFDALIFWNYAKQFLQDGFWHGLLHTVPPREPGYPVFLYACIRLFGESLAPRVVVGIQFMLLYACAL